MVTGVTMGYRGLHWVTGDYKEVTIGHRKLKWVTGD